MSGDKKKSKLKARLPRGLSDRGPAEIAATRRMIEKIREVYERYGFEPVETPAFEYTDALGKFLPDQDRPNEGVFSFQDDDEQWLSLRYDLTAPLARYVAEHFQNLALPYRSYRHGWVFRNEKPGPGRFRQFMQFDADTVGSASPAADAEMCMMAADTMEALGIPRGSYVVKIWNRKCLDGIQEASGIPPDKTLPVLRSVDKKDRVGLFGVQQLLDKGRKDDSGDFTRGAELIPAANNFITYSLTQMGLSYRSEPLFSHDELRAAEETPRKPFDFNDYRVGITKALQGNRLPDVLESGLNDLEEIQKLVHASGYIGRIKIDETVVRGLEYYTGPVFEVELTFPIEDEKGNPVRFGSVGGGGRYDGLVSRFMGQPVPATGFSIGVSRLMAALRHLKKIEDKPAPGPVVVTVFDRERIADYQRMVQQLRDSPLDPNRPDGPRIRAELYLGNPRNFGNQLKYADRRHSPCVVIQGSDERQRGVVQIKDLIAGTEAAIFHDAVGTAREEYLGSRLAQFAVPEGQLVEAVRALLARHKVAWE